MCVCVGVCAYVCLYEVRVIQYTEEPKRGPFTIIYCQSLASLVMLYHTEISRHRLSIYYSVYNIQYLIDMKKTFDLVSSFSLGIEEPQLPHKVVDLFSGPVLLLADQLGPISTSSDRLLKGSGGGESTRRTRSFFHGRHGRREGGPGGGHVLKSHAGHAPRRAGRESEDIEAGFDDALQFVRHVLQGITLNNTRSGLCSSNNTYCVGKRYALSQTICCTHKAPYSVVLISVVYTLPIALPNTLPHNKWCNTHICNKPRLWRTTVV